MAPCLHTYTGAGGQEGPVGKLAAAAWRSTTREPACRDGSGSIERLTQVVDLVDVPFREGRAPMIEAKGYAAYDAQSSLKPFAFGRRDLGDSDVLIDILYCGVCHSDLHQVRNEWSGTRYPVVPGHEIVGRVAGVGAKATKFRAGDTVGVGCFVDSCRRCDACRRGLENYCVAPVMTYNSLEKDKKTPTYGGYSSRVVVDQDFVLRVAAKGRLEAVAPLLCAGITTFSPLRHWKIGKGHRVAVLGLGGLGHMAVKLGNALGAEVTLLSS